MTPVMPSAGPIPAWPVCAAFAAACLLAPFSAPALAPIIAAGGLGAGFVLWRRRALMASPPGSVVKLLLLIWLLLPLSALWGLSARATLVAFQGLGAVLLGGLLLIWLAFAYTGAAARHPARLCLMAYAALLLIALLEYQSNGAIYAFLTGYLHPSAGNWQLSSLNRTTVIASLALWPMLLLIRKCGFGLIALAAAVLVVGWLAFSSTQLTARPAFLLGLGVALATLIAGRIAAHALAASAALATVILPLLALGPLAPSRLEPLFNGLHFSVLHRLHVWQFTAQRILEKPLLGWGLDAAQRIPGGDATFSGDAKLMPSHPHNGILHVWLELGAVGALLLLAMQILIWRALASKAISREARAAAAGLYACAMTYFLMAFGVWQNWWMATLLLVAALMVFAERAKFDARS